MHFLGLWQLLLIVILVGVAVLLFRRTQPEREPLLPTAREILDCRYAAGALTREQYEQMKRDLGD